MRSVRDEFDLTVLLVEHHMAMVMGISDKVVVLDFGSQDRRRLADRDPRQPACHRGLPGDDRLRDRCCSRSAELRAGYGPVRVLHGIDFKVDEGEVVVILGANGAGKTTTLRASPG